MKFTSFVGIDISKQDFDVALLNNRGIILEVKKFPNSSSGFSRLKKWLGSIIHLKEALFGFFPPLVNARERRD